MAFIKKIRRHPLGEFKVHFSTRDGTFEVRSPTIEISQKTHIRNAPPLKTWDDVNKELDRIVGEYLHEEMFIRRVIIIQLQTSESNYIVVKDKLVMHNQEKEIEEVQTEDHLWDGEGFILKWFVADELEFMKGDLRYRVTEKHNNCRHNYNRIEILPQLLFSSNGEMRVLDYSRVLYQFLISFSERTSTMLKELISFFHIEEDKFLNNIYESTLQLTACRDGENRHNSPMTPELTT